MKPLPSTSPTLSRFDNALLRLGHHIVPADERNDWVRCWHAELWYAAFCHPHHMQRAGRSPRPGLSAGLLRDAVWLRTDSWRAALSGTALLCLGLLAGMAGLAALPALVFVGDLHSFAHLAVHQCPRFAVASSLVLFVSCVNASGSMHRKGSFSVLHWCKARLFFLSKVLLLLLVAFLISTDLTLSMEARGFFVAVPLQLLCFVVLALLALRWNQLDGERRCKRCLRALAAPARVGRPSWNFLEYNGTELVCQDGHGLLTIPEIETSWCQSSTWIAQP